MELKEYLASITAVEREISLLSTPGTVSYNNYPPPSPPSLHNVYNVVITKEIQLYLFRFIDFCLILSYS